MDGYIKTREARSVWGRICVFLFWAWNALMLWMLWGFFQNLATMLEEAKYDEWATTGVEIGATLGLLVQLGIWAAGSAVFGWMVRLTRGDEVLIPIEEQDGRRSPSATKSRPSARRPPYVEQVPSRRRPDGAQKVKTQETQGKRPGVFSSYIAPLLALGLGATIAATYRYGPDLAAWAEKVADDPAHLTAWCTASEGIAGAFCDGVRKGAADNPD